MRYESETRKCDQCGAESTSRKGMIGGVPFGSWVSARKRRNPASHELQELDFCCAVCAAKHMLAGASPGPAAELAIAGVHAYLDYVGSVDAMTNELRTQLRELADKISAMEIAARSPK